MVVRVAAMAMSLLLLAVAVLSIELVGKFECGGGENETPPPQGSALRDYCDSDAAYVSLLAPIVVALGWVHARLPRLSDTLDIPPEPMRSAGGSAGTRRQPLREPD